MYYEYLQEMGRQYGMRKQAAPYTGEDEGIRNASEGLFGHDYVIYKNLDGKPKVHEQPYLRFPRHVLAEMDDDDRRELVKRLSKLNDDYESGNSKDYSRAVLANDIAYNRKDLPSRFGGTLAGLGLGTVGGAAAGAGLANLLGGSDSAKVFGGLAGAAGLGTLLTYLGNKRDKAKRVEDMQEFIDDRKKKLKMSDEDVDAALQGAVADNTKWGPLSGSREAAIAAVIDAMGKK